jgi:hypothetical protein
MNSIVVYRNPLEQWFWETGWIYIGSIALVVVIIYLGYLHIVEKRDKAFRKKRWKEMTPGQRESWRYFNRRNNFEHEEWENE